MEEEIKTEEIEVVEAEVILDEDMEDDNIEEDITSNDEGTFDEVYRDKRTGNIVTHPKLRNKNQDNNRREVCWSLYVKSVRDGNPSASAAAREAGFSPNTAVNITKMSWFKEKKDKLRRSKMMNNAEKNIARILNMGYIEMKKMEDGSEKEVVDRDVLRIVADMSKTIVTTLGKDLGYSNKTEVKVTSTPMPILELDAINPQELIGTNESVEENPASIE